MRKNKKIVIIGASGHGRVVADIAQLNGYIEVVFLDDDSTIKQCGKYKVVGTTSDIDSYKDFDFIVAIGCAAIRQKIFEKLNCMHLNVVTLIHPQSVVASDVKIGRGTVVMAGAVINPGAIIGNGVIINTTSSVDHDCRIGDFSHISVGSHIAGTCNIGERTWIGAGAIVSNNIDICPNCMIGCGSVVIKNIVVTGTYVGVPSRKL